MVHNRFLLFLVFVPRLGAVELKPETLKAFHDYVAKAEAGITARDLGANFLWSAESPVRLQQMRQGTIIVDQAAEQEPIRVPGGFIHDWIGAMFIPNTTLEKTVGLTHDYARHSEIYKPEVMETKLLSKQGNDYHIRMRLLKKKVITVVLDADFDVHFVQVSPTRSYSTSRSTRIVEVQNAGTPNEAKLPPNQGRGFLWRVNSYWRFEERDGGVYEECEAISLTRDIPAGLSWLVEPVIRQLPRDSLFNTLRETREGVAKLGARSVSEKVLNTSNGLPRALVVLNEGKTDMALPHRSEPDPGGDSH